MKKYIKNNVLHYTFFSITVMLFATWDMDIKSISGLWHTDYRLLYSVFVLSNAILFMIGDNQMPNKIAGFMLICMFICPVSTPDTLPLSQFTELDYLHHMFAVLFFIIKPLNHRRYDAFFTIIGGACLFSLNIHLYTIEMIGLYSLVWQGHITKVKHFRKLNAYAV